MYASAMFSLRQTSRRRDLTIFNKVVMADDVTSLIFRGKYDNRPDTSSPANCVSTMVNVQISMEITRGDQIVHQCESVVPRRTNQ